MAKGKKHLPKAERVIWVVMRRRGAKSWTAGGPGRGNGSSLGPARSSPFCSGSP